MRMKTLRGTPLHLSKIQPLGGFTYLMLNLPFVCNYQCKKCFNSGETVDLLRTLHGPNFLSIEEIGQLVMDAKALGGRVVVLAGEGEPILHPGIDKILQMVVSNEMIPIVYSNASSLTKANLKMLKEHDASIVVSLDSLKPKTYDFLTGTKGRLKTVMQNIRHAREMFADAAEKIDGISVVRLAINTSVTLQNEKELEHIKKFCGDDIFFVCNPLVDAGNALPHWQQLIGSENNYARICKKIPSVSESGGPLTLSPSGNCAYSEFGIGVSPTGDYLTCAYAQNTAGQLGNVRSISLTSAFWSKQRFEKQFYQAHGPAPCLFRCPKFKGIC